MIAEGLNNRDIANRLYISEKNRKKIMFPAYLKSLKVNDRIQAAIFAFKTNIKKNIRKTSHYPN